jgi:sugar phosphate permease
MYEKTNYNMNLTLIISFAGSCVGFLGMYLISSPFVNIVFAVLAILLSNCAASVLWSIYCPSLRDTGMVSSATGFLDFASYGAAALASSLFANAANSIGWKNLILVWLALMVIGTLICLPQKKRK